MPSFQSKNTAIYKPLLTGLFINSDQSTKSPLTFFSASAGAVHIGQTLVLTLIASGAAAAFCYFSAEGKVKKNLI
jgi:hypothetical protein